MNWNAIKEGERYAINPNPSHHYGPRPFGLQGAAYICVSGKRQTIEGGSSYREVRGVLCHQDGTSVEHQATDEWVKDVYLIGPWEIHKTELDRKERAHQLEVFKAAQHNDLALKLASVFEQHGIKAHVRADNDYYTGAYVRELRLCHAGSYGPADLESMAKLLALLRRVPV